MKGATKDIMRSDGLLLKLLGADDHVVCNMSIVYMYTMYIVMCV